MTDTYHTTDWRGKVNYECNFCPYASLDLEALEKHQLLKHRRELEEARRQPPPPAVMAEVKRKKRKPRKRRTSKRKSSVRRTENVREEQNDGRTEPDTANSGREVSGDAA